MNLTANQKRLFVVLAITLVGLTIDQFIGGPEPASATTADSLLVRPAADPAAAGAGQSSPSRADKAPTVRTWGAPGIQSRLASLATTDAPATDDSDHRDPFRAEQRVQIRVPTSAATDSRDAAREAADAFASKHQLRAIIGSGPKGVVLISDRMVRVGEGLEGWKLVSIEKTAAVFERAGIRVRFGLSDALTPQ